MLRERILGLNQREFADLLGVVQTTISVAENKTTLSRKLANYMVENIDGLNIQWLMTGKGDVFDLDSKYKDSEALIKTIQQQNIDSINSSNMISGGSIKGKLREEFLESELAHKDEIITQLKERIEAQNKQIESKDKQIELLSRLLEKANS